MAGVDVQELLTKPNKTKKEIISVFYFLSKHDFDQAYNFIRGICEEKGGVLWPYIYKLYILALKGEKIEVMRQSALLLKFTKSFDEYKADTFAIDVYTAMREAFYAGHRDVLAALNDLAMRIRPYGKSIISKSDEGKPLAREEFKAKILDETKKFMSGETELPLITRLHRKQVIKPIESFKDRKVLCVFRQHVYSFPTSRELELIDFYERSADATPLNYRAFLSDVLVHAPLYEEDIYEKELDRLEEEIRQWKPDIVYFDNLLAHTNEDAQAKLFTRLEGLKKKYGFILAAFYIDVWTLVQETATKRVADLADIIHITHSTLLDQLSEEVRQKTYCFPCPYPKEIFDWPEIKKSQFAGFHGSLLEVRLPWVLAMEKEDVNLYMHFSSHQASDDLGTMEGYGKAISRFKVSVVLSARNTIQTSITGTVWESMLAGSVIFEEKCEETRLYFVPFVHYIPFASIHQLKAYLTYLREDEEIMDLINKNAQLFFEESYHPNLFWSGLLSMADEIRTKEHP
jgi:hypothetical protein